MLKWLKRIVATLAVLLVLIVALAVVGLILAQSTPDWYRPGSMSDIEREAAVQSATNKLIALQNETAMARADEQAARRNGTPSTRASGMVITLTDDELNALLASWSVWQSVKSSYERYLKDPYIVLQDGRIILSGRLNEVDAIASVHFEPGIDENGMLHLTLAKVLAGKLPLPTATMAKYQKRAAEGLQRRLPAWRSRATIDPTGISNDAAVSAVLGEMLMNILNREAAPPVVFMEVVSKGKVPVKLSGIQILDDTLKLTVLPMTASEREQLLQSIREPGSPSAAAR